LNQDPVKPQTAIVGSAAFWKKRVGRALVVLALALLATQVLPELPADQQIQVVAPEGYLLEQVDISYSTSEGDAPLSGTQLHFSPAAPIALHTARLKNGIYRVALRASALPRQRASNKNAEAPVLLRHTATVELTGDGARIFLER
jgi:hypothetical protein